MTWITPDFKIGQLSDVSSLSLVLRTDPYGYDFIVAESNDGMLAIILNPEGEFNSFPVGDVDDYGGLIIDDIGIEVDLDLDPDRNLGPCPLGAVERKRDGVFLRCKPSQGRGGFGYSVRLITGLPECPNGTGAAFTKWSIVKGARSEKKVLYTIDVSSSDQLKVKRDLK